jgi:hypothetical protein
MGTVGCRAEIAERHAGITCSQFRDNSPKISTAEYTQTGSGPGLLPIPMIANHSAVINSLPPALERARVSSRDIGTLRDRETVRRTAHHKPRDPCRHWVALLLLFIQIRRTRTGPTLNFHLQYPSCSRYRRIGFKSLGLMLTMTLRAAFGLAFLQPHWVSAFPDIQPAEGEASRAFQVLGNLTHNGVTGLGGSQQNIFERQSCAQGYNQCGKLSPNES